MKTAVKALCASLTLALAAGPGLSGAAQAAKVKAGASCKEANATATVKGKTYVCKRTKGKLKWKVLKVKAGARCSEFNATAIYRGKTYVCDRVNGKLVWKAVIPTVEDNYEMVASDLEACRLRESRNITGAGAKGFPMRGTLPTRGDLKIAIIPVDFDNAQGVGRPADLFADDVTEIAAWGKFFSRDRMTYHPYLASPTWLRAPKGAEWYVCVECNKGASESKQSMAAGLQQLIDVADPEFDFSDTDFVYFLFPHEAESKFGTSLYFHQTTISTAEGPQSVAVYGERGGSSQPEERLTRVWSHLIHEVLHFQGWIGHGPYNDTSVMTYDGGPSKAVTSWEAFMAGWLEEQEIVCLEAASLDAPAYITMSSLDRMGSKPISTMVRLSDEELLIIERRSNGTYSDFTKAFSYGGQLTNLDNFTAYRVNVNGRYQRVDGRDFAEIGDNFWGYVLEDGQLRIRKSVSYSGVTVTVVGSHQIRINVAG